MKKLIQLTVFSLILFSLMLMVTGCGQAAGGAAAADTLSGTVTVSGAWALYPLMVRWAEEFQKIHPNVQFDISAGGAGKGMADALAKAVDIGMVSREIHPAEIEQGAFGLPVAKDAVFPTINAQNPLWSTLKQTGVSKETLMGIFISGNVTSWEQVAGQTGSATPIHVFTRSDACGAADTWAAFLGGKQEDLLGVGVYGDPGLLDAVIKDPNGIGFNNLNYIFDMDSGQLLAGAQILPLDINGSGQIEPDELFATKAEAVGAVSAGRYPSPPARDLYLVTQGQPTGLTNTFITWVLTDGQAFVDEAGYVAVTPAKLTEGLQKLK